MSAQTIAEAFAPAEASYRSLVMVDTWGYLAPIKGRTYRGYVVFAVGCFGNDPLNPTVLDCILRNKTLGDLDSSPWFFDCLAEFLSNLATRGRYHDDSSAVLTEGDVYRWEGTFRNYTFDGQLTRLSLVAESDGQ